MSWSHPNIIRFVLPESSITDYVDSGIIHEDDLVHIRSTESHILKVPAVLLAIHSPLLKDLLSEPLYLGMGNPVSIITQLPSAHIEAVVRFVKSGELPFSITSQLYEAFRSLGIWIKNIDLSVKATAREMGSSSAVNVSSPPNTQAISTQVTQEQSMLSTGIQKPETPTSGFITPDEAIEQEDSTEEDDIMDEDEDCTELQQPKSEEEAEYEPGSSTQPSSEPQWLPWLDFGVSNEAKEWMKMKREYPWNTFPEKGSPDAEYEAQMKGPNNSRVFCQECGFSTLRRKVFEQHKLHHKYKDLDRKKCYCTVMQCFKQLDSFQEWMAHGKEVHKGKMYQCYQCDNLFKSLEGRDRHVRRTHDVSDEYRQSVKVTCVHCGAKFKCVKAYDKHRRYESKYHGNKCAYDDCKETFEMWSQHESHIESAHQGQKIYICGICPKTFSTKRLKSIHRLTLHPDSRKGYIRHCNLCGKATNSIPRHLALVHDQDTPGYCPICRTEVQKHIQHWAELHSGHLKKPLFKDLQHNSSLCTFCGRSFTKAGGLARHVAWAHPQSSQVAKDPVERLCTFCGKSFRKGVGLAQHMRHKHPEERKKME